MGLRTFTQAEFDTSSERGRLANVGDPLTQQLYVVCKRCNNGWMSQLQTKATYPPNNGGLAGLG
jgi:hypothetical protein